MNVMVKVVASAATIAAVVISIAAIFAEMARASGGIARCETQCCGFDRTECSGTTAKCNACTDYDCKVTINKTETKFTYSCYIYV